MHLGIRDKGIAMILALMTMVLLAGIGTLLFARTVNEMRHSADDVGIVQTLLLARGGANLGGSLLGRAIRDELNAIVNVRSSTTDCWSFGTGNCGGDAPTVSSVVDQLSGSNSVASILQARVDELLCSNPITAVGDGTVEIRVYVTEQACGQGLPSGVSLPSGRFISGEARPAPQDYAIPFVLVSEGVLGPYRRNVVLQGEYQFTVGRVTFARYALFTSHHRIQSGNRNTGAIWFTTDTMFDGPVHTNEHFRFANQPWFGHMVTSAGCYTDRRETFFNPVSGAVEERCSNNPTAGAYFYNDPDRLRTGLSAQPSFGGHTPDLAGGVDWGASFVPLPTNSFEQQELAKTSGIYFGDNVNLQSLKFWAADNNGNELAGGATGRNAVYQYVEGVSGTTTRTFRFDATGALEELDRTVNPNVWREALNTSGVPISRFNGVVYVDGSTERFHGPARRTGSIDSAPPAIAHFAQMTLAATRYVRITSDIKYEDPPCTGAPRRVDGAVVRATCDNLDSRNVFGLYVQDADVLIGHNHSGSSAHLNAPEDVAIHGVLMSSTGAVRVEDYNRGNVRGNVRLLGGIIENIYGAFGTFRGTSMSTGFGRSFTYDQRMYSSVSPPYFPTIGLDRVREVRIFSFGQREQVF